MNGGIRAARLWAGSDLRRRWLSLVMLGVLAGATAASAFGALAGARRTASALPRLERTVNAPSAIVFASQAGSFNPDFARLARQPEVASLAIWDLLFGDVDGTPGGVLFGSHDGRWGGQIDRPVVLRGRMWNPHAPDEIVVDENLARQLPLGATLAFKPFRPEQNVRDPSLKPSGPVVKLRVVGVVREIRQFLFVPDGQALVGPGFLEHHRKDAVGHPNADVILRRGAADIGVLQQDANRIVGPGTPLLDMHAITRRVNTTLAVERTALVALAASVAIAGTLLLVQALSRSAAVVGDDALVLRAMGMERRYLALAAVLSHLPTVLVGAAAGFGGAVLASGRFPVGLARHIDPDVGLHVDWTVLAPGALLTAILLAGGVALSALRSLPSGAGARRPRSTVASWIRSWAPLTFGLGATMALERRRGGTRGSVPVVPALVGAVVGVVGVVGALTIDHGLRDALTHPERAGVTWDVTVFPPQAASAAAGGISARYVARVQAASPGASAAVVDRDVISVNGVGVPTFTIRPVARAGAAPIELAVVKGHAPTRAGEVVIGPATAGEVHAAIGSTVVVGPGHKRLTVVGEGLFPTDVHAEFDQGLWALPADFDAIEAASPNNNDAAVVALRLPSGQHAKAAVDHLSAALGPDQAGVGPADVPVELANLSNVRRLPELLAAFLAFLAIGALSHVLVTSSHRSRHDFAILRALGMRRRGTRLVLNAQASAIGVVGLLVGIPLGVAVGRTGWRLVTERVPLADVPPFAALTVALVVPATILLVNALAVLPGRRVARLRPAEVLRRE
ncbi:MAG: hypothetical protein JWN46_2378 [Acidimicrobiales bacterium]|nr:hypothetical protein [Acidimicrobiales bacterium]